jgi:hypothetical protein
MKKYFFLSTLILSFFIAFQGASLAITVTASPSPATVNQPVTVTINSSYTAASVAPSCTLAVDFGNGSPEVILTACTTASCSRTTSHTYTAPGQYTITARSLADACLTPPTGPNPATASLTVRCTPLVISSPASLPPGSLGTAYSYPLQATGGQPPYTWSLPSGALPPGINLSAPGTISGTPAASGSYNFTTQVSDTCPTGAQSQNQTFNLTIGCPPITITSPTALPAGTAGQPYNYQLQTTGGQAPVSFALTAGTLPPGLTLSASSLISGTPTTAGTYNFTISAADSCTAGTQQVQRAFSLVIGGGDLRMTVTPASLRIPRNMASTHHIRYSFSNTAAAAMTLTSAQGIFTANSRIIGETSTPLNISLVNGTGSISESLTIPPAVTRRAEEAGTSRIIYTRTFTSGTLAVTAQTELIVGTEMTAEFSINRLQLYFENQRAEITVDRNQPGLKAFADIRYSGSGLLNGYWEVDGRILEYVNQHLVYGTTLTLATPDVPSLPTFAPGTHLVRFVITSPSPDIPIPQAIYFVTAKESGEVRTIDLTLPEDQSELPYAPVLFEWKPVKWADTYLIVFKGNSDEKPVFSAYTRESVYRLPELILESLFVRDKVYYWQVKGYDADGNILGESGEYRFRSN